jgi:polyhydroxybutyrate depolymerase
MRRLALSAALWLCMAGLAAAACGTSEDPCTVPGGSYHAVLPEDGPPKGALMFLHGWGGSGAGALRLTGMVWAFTEAGYAVIAPNGVPREGRAGGTWAFHPDWPARRDEVAFLQAVKADAAARFGFDAGHVLLAGFSIGGSMTSYTACAAPQAFAAYAPVGGGFWRPHPEGCAGPVRLLHTHGWADDVVPLEGRAVRGADARDPGAVVQGDIFAGLEIWRQTNDCRNHMPQRRAAEGPFWTRTWTDCAPGSALVFALHPGGHSVPNGWAEMALRWFEGGE